MPHRCTHFLFALFGLCLIAGPGQAQARDQGADDQDPLARQQRELVRDASAIIQDWRDAGGGDEQGERPLIIALFTGSDTDPAPQYRQRLTRTMRHIQAFYAREMRRHGFGPLTFKLQTDEDDLMKIHVVKGEKPNAEYDGKDGQHIRNLVIEQLKQEGIDGHRETLVIFCNLTVWDPDTRRMKHHSPYYASGSSRQGTAWQLDSALLDPAQLANTDRERFLHDGQYGHISLGRYQSIFVGGVCHELGHALGLPHNLERADERERWGTALMGSGNFTYGRELREDAKGSFLTLAHAMKLAVHPAFTGSIKQMNTRPKTRYTELTVDPINDNKALRIAGQIEGDTPVHAVIAYLDPEGNRDYNATTHVAVPDKDGRFSIDCTSFAKQNGTVRLVRVHANGWARFADDLTFAYTRDAEGTLAFDPPDLSKQLTDAGGGDAVHAIAPCPCERHRSGDPHAISGP